VRWLLRHALTRPRLFGAALRLGQLLRPLLPDTLRRQVPRRQEPGPTPTRRHERLILLLQGCVQQAATPRTNAAARRVFDKLGIALQPVTGAGCCGAVNYHLAAHEDGLDDMRRNIDAWWPGIESGAEAIVSSASGCGSMLADYGRLLAHDPAYAGRARRVSELARDIGEVLLEEDLGKLQIDRAVGTIAVHTPCSLQHGMKQPRLIQDILAKAGLQLATTRNSHLCCGSAGTYSVLEPDLSRRLRDEKLLALTGDSPELIVTGNVGCQLHLAGAAPIPVMHWIEVLDAGGGHGRDSAAGRAHRRPAIRREAGT
jgi:glycolate oxidase iron-sulfur subunit